jgi:tetratricopeptide (TPR) repeat protein
MTDQTTVAKELRAFLTTYDEQRVEAIAPMVSDLSVRELESLFTMYADVVSAEVVQRLIDKTHGLLSRDTYKALLFGQLAVKLAQYVWSSIPEEDARMEGDAWKEFASAHLKMSNFEQARFACEQANLFYSLVNDRDYERTILGLIEGQVLHFLGMSDRGLVRIEQSANLLLAVFQRRKKYVEARIIYATILLRLERWKEALHVLESSRDIAQEEGDLETLAHIVNNLGVCYTNLNDQRMAKQCFNAARDMFTQLELWAEVQRPQVGLAVVLVQEGKYQEAISELYKSREVFLWKLKMPLDAARVAARIVEVSLLAHKPDEAIARLCAETITTFQNADLHREAMKALAYLHEMAQLRKVQMDDVQRVQAFLETFDDSNNDVRFDAADGQAN